MGLLDSLSGALGGAASPGGGADLSQLVGALLGPDGRGLSQLIAQLQQGGLGEAVQSWISTGANLPVSAEQLQSALGPDTVARLTQALGDGDLARMLPQIIDRLTPQGQLPEGGLGADAGLGDLGSLVGSLLRR